jgi:hypothetical protein
MISRTAIRILKDDLPFYSAKFRHLLERKIDPTLTQYPEHLTTLRRDGILLIKDFLTSTQIEKIIDEIRGRTDLMTDRKSANVVKRNARYLLLKADELLPSARVFFQSEVVNGLAQAYLSKHAILDRPAAQLKLDIGQKSIVDFFHIDEWRYLISCFLFLNDVGAEEAPMIYLKGSHKQRLWRLAKEKEFFFYYRRDPGGVYLNEESPYCGCCLPTEARRLRERYDFEAITCTGKAGTLMIFDNLGLHRATELRKNYRLILSGYWMLPDSQCDFGANTETC